MTPGLILAAPIILALAALAAVAIARRLRARRAARSLVYRIRVVGAEECQAKIRAIVDEAKRAQARIDALPKPTVRLVVERESDATEHVATH